MEGRSRSPHPIACSVVILLIVRRRQDARRAGFLRPPAVHPRCLSLESFCHLHLLSSSLTPPPFRPRTFRPCFRARATNRFLSGTSPSLCSTSMASYGGPISETIEKISYGFYLEEEKSMHQVERVSQSSGQTYTFPSPHSCYHSRQASRLHEAR